MIRSPRQFLCEFLLAGAFLLVGWTYVSDLYLESLLGGVNLGLWFTNASIYLRSGEPFGQGVACPEVIAAAALFTASSSRSLRWRLRGVVVSVSILWFLQAGLIVLELHLVTRQVAGQELVALIRSWSGPALVLMVWVGCGSLLGSRAEEQENPQATALESTPVPAQSQDGYRSKTRSKKTKKGKSKRRRHHPQEARGATLQPTLS
ncbi:MAG: hypothetical protein VX733_02450 [Candidatus Latescibacterota bacterium]|nr:hypothetical protein [Candidatus Latescibacterota bacterium]